MPRTPTTLVQPGITILATRGRHVYFVVYDIPAALLHPPEEPSNRAQLERQANSLVGALVMN
jgi:hypothetical protein